MSSEATLGRAQVRYARRANHILDNYYIAQDPDPAKLSIWGYTDAISYGQGDEVKLYVSTSADQWQVSVIRDHLVPSEVYVQNNLPGQFYPAPEDCSVNGCGWPVALSFSIGDDWQSGGYLVTLTGFRGGESITEHHFFVVRGKAKAPKPMLLLCATGTWLAYNCWGGSNAYEGITGPDKNQFSPRLSWQRPWTRGFCKLPAGAPRPVPDVPSKPEQMVRYPYMEWAYAYGYSKKYASAGWASYERHFVHWAESQGYELDVATHLDLHAHPKLLDDYACLVCVGHDEYWSANMRDAVDHWVEQGGKVARFAGNFMWQVRIEGQQQVCYKYIAKQQDPIQDQGMSGAWDEPRVNRPGASTFGANALQGLYAGVGRCVPQAHYTVYQPEHWAFAGCQLGYGDAFGVEAKIFGYEVDGVDVAFKQGLPQATGKDGAATDINIIAMGLASNVEPDHQIWGETLYLGDSDAQWIADVFAHSELADSAARGNGVMVHWQKGRGEVFNAATCEWVMGLTRGDGQVETVTNNVLRRFLA